MQKKSTYLTVILDKIVKLCFPNVSLNLNFSMCVRKSTGRCLNQS